MRWRMATGFVQIENHGNVERMMWIKESDRQYGCVCVCACVCRSKYVWYIHSICFGTVNIKYFILRLYLIYLGEYWANERCEHWLCPCPCRASNWLDKYQNRIVVKICHSNLACQFNIPHHNSSIFYLNLRYFVPKAVL